MNATRFLSTCALLVCAASTVQAAPRDTTISEPALGLAFEVPRGCTVRQSVDSRGAKNLGWFNIGNERGEPLVMVGTFGPGIFRAVLGDGPLSVPGDTLLSYAMAEALQLCFGGAAPDSIVALHRYRNAKGAEVFEVYVKSHPNNEYIGEEPDEADSVTATDTVGRSPTEDAGGSAFIAGPVFVVNLSRGGARLLVEVSPWGWYEGLPAEWREVARRISQTLRWL
jgi:hypothetical protein